MTDFIPDKLKHEFNHLGQQRDDNAWTIGDRALSLEREMTVIIDGEEALINRNTEELMTRGAFYSGVAAEVRCVAQTVRDYMYVSRNVSKATRHRYDMLGRHHHKAIVPHAKGVQKVHKALCEEWLEKADDYGGNIGPVWALRLWLGEKDGAPAWWEGALKRLRKLAARIAEDEEAPAKVRNACSELERRLR